MTSPVTVQSDFRVRNDDGSQTTATWVAAQNTNASLLANKNYRMRFNIRETNNRAFTLDAQIEYNLGGAGWNAVNASSSVVRSSASPNFADDDATTEQLAGAGTFTAGKMEEVNGLAAAIAIQNNDTEVEFCFQIRSADVASGNTIQLRVTDAGTALTTYSQTPTITVLQAYTVAAAQGSYTLSGQAVNLLYGRLLAAAQGSYALSGQAATLSRGFTFPAAQGGYALSGQAVNFPRTYVLAAAQGGYTLSGQGVNLLFGRVLAAAQGNYTLAGQTAALLRGYPLSIGQGAYSLSGQAAGLLKGSVLAAAQGTYALSGQSVNLLHGRVLAAGQGSYTLSGQAVDLIYTPSAGAPAGGSLNLAWPVFYLRPLECVFHAIRTPEEWGAWQAEIVNAGEASAIYSADIWGALRAEIGPVECIAHAPDDETEEYGRWRGARQPDVKDMLLALLAARDTRRKDERGNRTGRA